MIQKNNFFVLTGGPGSGKTSLIDELTKRGYNCVPEVARVIIKDQIFAQGDALPWLDTKKYSKLMLNHSVRDFVNLCENKQMYFFDRGIVDTYGYEKLMKFDIDTELLQSVNEYRYNKMVFILPPWKLIYHTDNERKQDFKIAKQTYEVMREAYRESGYELCEIPRMTVQERADFIIKKVKETTSEYNS